MKRFVYLLLIPAFLAACQDTTEPGTTASTTPTPSLQTVATQNSPEGVWPGRVVAQLHPGRELFRPQKIP